MFVFPTLCCGLDLWLSITGFPSCWCSFHFIDVLFHNCMITTRLKYVASNYTCVLVTSCKMKKTLFKILNRGYSRTCFGYYIWRQTPFTRGLHKYNNTVTSKGPHQQRHWFPKARDHMRGFFQDLNREDFSVGSIWKQSGPQGKPEARLLLRHSLSFEDDTRVSSWPASISNQDLPPSKQRYASLTARGPEDLKFLAPGWPTGRMWTRAII